MSKLKLLKDIKTVDDWFRMAPPKKGIKQWKPFYSAMESAAYFTSTPGKMPKAIDDYLKSIGVKSDQFEAEPEAVTNLSKYGKGEGRNHDLLIKGKDVVIGVEAKAAESLDDYVDKKYNPVNENHRARYFNLCRDILDKNLDKDDCSDIRYQLLSATAGTILEAEKAGKPKAVLIILVFVSDHSKDAVEHTRSDVIAFENAIAHRKNCNGSYNLTINPNIDFFVKFIDVKVSDYR